MDPQRQLHIKRLREALDQVSELRQPGMTYTNPVFVSWKERTIQSLSQVFGTDHLYCIRFARLRFWSLPRSLYRGGLAQGEEEKREAYERDLKLAEDILQEALEEAEITPRSQTQVSATKSANAPPSVVVNVTNVLSQTASFQIDQVLKSLDELELSDEERARAKRCAEELEQEIRGQQRWPVLAKSLEVLRGLGKAVYERVALPLLLDMLKRQAGL